MSAAHERQSTSQTPSQTVGPFWHGSLLRAAVDDLDPDRDAGTSITLVGEITDGDGAPVGDAMLEVWQADGTGRYEHPADGRSGDVPSRFLGFGRVATAPDGSYRLTTVLPGTVPGPDGTIQAPHLGLQVFARGLLDHLSTRVYFEGQEANATDPVLASVPEARRSTLLAVDTGDGTYRFDIRLQGDAETVFFAV